MSCRNEIAVPAVHEAFFFLMSSWDPHKEKTPSSRLSLLEI